MPNYPAPEAILKGIEYLDDEYPNWWQKVDITTLDMYDPLMHVLAQTQGCLVYETNEIVFWAHHELVQHGFVPCFGKTLYGDLTSEWVFQVNRVQSERK